MRPSSISDKPVSIQSLRRISVSVCCAAKAVLYYTCYDGLALCSKHPWISQTLHM